MSNATHGWHTVYDMTNLKVTASHTTKADAQRLKASLTNAKVQTKKYQCFLHNIYTKSVVCENMPEESNLKMSKPFPSTMHTSGTGNEMKMHRVARCQRITLPVPYRVWGQNPKQSTVSGKEFNSWIWKSVLQGLSMAIQDINQSDH